MLAFESYDREAQSPYSRRSQDAVCDDGSEGGVLMGTLSSPWPFADLIT
jgi:hypothetical protein